MSRLSLRCALLMVVAYCAMSAGGAGANPIQDENAQPGTSNWLITKFATNHEIEGYASATSVERGDSLSLFVNTSDPQYTIDVYRTGWYGGIGARLVTTVTRPGIAQPLPTPDPATGFLECQWTPSYSLLVPDTWCSGVYLARLTASPSGKQSYIVFVVRNDSLASQYLFQCSVLTYEAYNNWGGQSLYSSQTLGDFARKVSFDRPYAADGVGDYFRYEYPMVRFLEHEGYDVTYCTDIDTHARPDLLWSHAGFLVVGHDEYWSREMRDHVEAARDDHRVNLAFFAANVCYWQVRLEPDAGGHPNRTVVGYKLKALQEDPYALDANPSNDSLITTRWRQAPVHRPEEDLVGVMYGFSPVRADLVASDVSHWVFANTGMSNGDHVPGLVGYEADHVVDDPRSVHILARSPVPDSTCRQPETGCVPESHATIYQAGSGAIVFASGTIFWDRGLDDFVTNTTFEPRIEQITRNILARFAAAPCIERKAGMVSWWPGEASAHDAINGFDGSLDGGATYGPGRVGQAFEFHGDGDVDVTDQPALRFGRAFTFEAWIHPNSVAGAQQIMSKGTSGDRAYAVALGPNGLLELAVSGDGSSETTIDSPTGLIAADTWSHVAATFDSGLVHLYVDGTLVATSATSIPSIHPGTADVYLGARNGGDPYFSGWIDEPAVYDRALVAADIQAIYNCGSAGRCPLTSSDQLTAHTAAKVRLPWPNPARRATQFDFDVPRRDRVAVDVIDVAGRRIRTLLHGQVMSAGTHRLQWNGVSDSGARVAPGVYLIRIATGDTPTVQRIVLLQ